MTLDEIRSLPARSADLLAAEKVLGWERLANVRAGGLAIDDAWLIRMSDDSHQLIEVEKTPAFSTDKTQVYILVDAMVRRGHIMVLRQVEVGPPAERWAGGFPRELGADIELFEAATAQDALTRAALIAIGA